MQLTAKDLGETGKDEIYGYGLIDAQSAVLCEEGESEVVITSAFIRRRM